MSKVALSNSGSMHSLRLLLPTSTVGRACVPQAPTAPCRPSNNAKLYNNFRAAAKTIASGVGFASRAAVAQQKRKTQQRRKQRRKETQFNCEINTDNDSSADDLTELSQARHVITVPNFSPVSQQLRDVFNDRFKNPRNTMQERFLWDYWYVKDQYTLHRTQAGAYFPEQLHEQLVDALLEYGEKQLGCRAISPVWMSYYVDGCGQELHCDSFHGPFAYVLSLTPWDRRSFTGGETMILQPNVLGHFWQNFQPTKGKELTDLVTLVEPHFNQLTVFDPRFPHGVRPVAGTRDPQQGRLVLHGWFTEPSPFFDGPLDEEDALDNLNAALLPMFDQLQALPPVTGTISMQLTVSGETGAVTDVVFLADTLIALPAAAADYDLGQGLLDSQTSRGAVQHTIKDHLLEAKFSTSQEGNTSITLPLVFD